MTETPNHRTLVGDGMWLTLASAINGIAAYAFAVIGTRYLGANGFADVSVGWSFWALTVAVITLPVQHWLTWRSEVDRGMAGILGAWRRLLLVGSVAVGLIALAGLHPRFFSDATSWALLVLGLGVGSWLLGWGRGMLAAHGEYRWLAFVIGGENLIRVIALLVAIGIEGGPFMVGSTLLTGPLILLFVWRLMLPKAEGLPKRVPVLRSVFALSGAMAMAQSILQLGPAAAAWLSLPDATVTATFSTFALFRAPVIVLLALSSRVTAPITRLVADRSFATLARLADRSAMAAVGMSGLLGGIGYLVGPSLVEIFFGPDTSLSATETGLTAAGMALAAYALLQLLLFLSSERTAHAVGIWIVATIVGATLLNNIGRGAVASAFFASELTAVLLGAGAHLSWLRSRVEARTR